MENSSEYKKECPGQVIDPRKPGTVTESDGTREVAWIVPDLRVAELLGTLTAAAQGEAQLTASDVGIASVVVAQYYHLMHLPETRQNKITRAIRAKIWLAKSGRAVQASKAKQKKREEAKGPAKEENDGN